jgi:hypothetical protein
MVMTNVLCGSLAWTGKDKAPVPSSVTLRNASKLFFILISCFGFFEFPDGEGAAARATRKHLSFREVELLLTTF